MNRWLARLLRLFFKHLYTTLAWAYDFVAWTTSMGQWQTWQSAALVDIPQGRLLELGQGPGHLLLKLLRMNRSALALDASRQMTRIAARRLHREGFPNHVLRARAQNIPFPNGLFDCVLSTFPSEYIFDAETLREIWRILKPGGEAIVIGVERITGRSIFDRFAKWLYRLTGQCGDPGETWSHPLERMGFKTQLERVHQARATVLRFVAKKPNRSTGAA